MTNRTRLSHVTLAAAFARGFHFDKDGIAAPAPTESLRDEAARLHTEARALFTKAKADGGRAFTADEQTEQDRRFSRLETIKTLIDDEARFAKLAFEDATGSEPTDDEKVQLPTDAPGRGQSNQFDAKNDAQRTEFNKAVSHWAGTGEMPRKFATITTSSQSGVYLPREIAATIVPTSANSLREAIRIQGMESVSLVTTPTTADLKVPVATGSAGGVVSENASSETENAPALSESINLNVATYQSGSTWYSNQVLSAGAVDVVNAVVPTLRYERELGLENAIIAGMIADSGITQVVTTASTHTADFSYANLVSLNRKLPKRFDAKKVILLSADAYTLAEGLTDTTGQPILTRDPQNQELLRFNGTPVIRTDYLETLAAGHVVGVIISLLGFRLRDAGDEQLARYTQVPTRPNQTGFNLFSFNGYGYAPSAVAKLKTAAS